MLVAFLRKSLRELFRQHLEVVRALRKVGGQIVYNLVERARCGNRRRAQTGALDLVLRESQM